MTRIDATLRFGLLIGVALCTALMLYAPSGASRQAGVPDTGQDLCFGLQGPISCPQPGQAFYGQDAQHESAGPAYRDNGDGTVTDLVTGLTWQQTPDFVQRPHADALEYAASLELGGHDDWRLPTIKELFSIADFMGNMHTSTPYIDTGVFAFRYPDTSLGNRPMDGQYWSSTVYLGRTMRNDESAFGFNFADGRIKSYPLRKKSFVRCVRGPAYGGNEFEDNGDGTVTDHATGLTWMQQDSGRPMTWQQALAWAEDLEFAGHDDWRLPDVKELQSIVDYSFAPDSVDPARRRPAIDPLFELTEPESWFWSSTTHLENRFAYYVSFGQAFSAKRYLGSRMNAHGAGAVRSDPKSGDPSRYAGGLGPQGDEIRIYNYVRAVRGG